MNYDKNLVNYDKNLVKNDKNLVELRQKPSEKIFLKKTVFFLCRFLFLHLLKLFKMDVNKLVSQSNVLTESRIEYTALERNIFYMVLGQISLEPRDYYHISVSEMMDKTGVKNNYVEYKEATERLTSVVYSFKRPENGNLLQVSLFASCEYLKGQGIIQIELSKKIVPYLFDLKQRMTIYQLEVALSLSSKYSKRLYEILSQWKDLKEKTFEILELKRMLDLYNPKTGVEQYKNWSDFENRVIKSARKDLKKINSDLTFDYKANKFGRKFTSITFKIESKSMQKTIDFKDDGILLFDKLINDFKLRKDQAKLIIDTYSEQEIKSKLYHIKLMINDNKVKNIGAYTMKSFIE